MQENLLFLKQSIQGILNCELIFKNIIMDLSKKHNGNKYKTYAYKMEVIFI